MGLKQQALEHFQSIRASLSFCLHMKNKYFNKHVILILIIIDISSTSSIAGYHFVLALANCRVQQRAEKQTHKKYKKLSDDDDGQGSDGDDTFQGISINNTLELFQYMFLYFSLHRDIITCPEY